MNQWAAQFAGDEASNSENSKEQLLSIEAMEQKVEALRQQISEAASMANGMEGGVTVDTSNVSGEVADALEDMAIEVVDELITLFQSGVDVEVLVERFGEQVTGIIGEITRSKLASKKLLKKLEELMVVLEAARQALSSKIAQQNTVSYQMLNNLKSLNALTASLRESVQRMSEVVAKQNIQNSQKEAQKTSIRQLQEASAAQLRQALLKSLSAMKEIDVTLKSLQKQLQQQAPKDSEQAMRQQMLRNQQALKAVMEARALNSSTANKLLEMNKALQQRLLLSRDSVQTARLASLNVVQINSVAQQLQSSLLAQQAVRLEQANRVAIQQAANSNIPQQISAQQAVQQSARETAAVQTQIKAGEQAVKAVEQAAKVAETSQRTEQAARVNESVRANESVKDSEASRINEVTREATKLTPEERRLAQEDGKKTQKPDLAEAEKREANKKKQSDKEFENDKRSNPDKDKDGGEKYNPEKDREIESKTKKDQDARDTKDSRIKPVPNISAPEVCHGCPCFGGCTTTTPPLDPSTVTSAQAMEALQKAAQQRSA